MTKSSCLISDCRNPVRTNGYCGAHYQRLTKYGNPLGGGTFHGEPLRFVHEVALLHTGVECLIWPYSNADGYGIVRVNGKHTVVSRYICELVNGPAPTPNHDAAHSCGKGQFGCIAPEHLDWKTKAQNQADKLVHGTVARGARNGRVKLTEAQAREILALKGVESQSKLAKMFMVAKPTIGNIHAGRCWAWLSKEIAA